MVKMDKNGLAVGVHSLAVIMIIITSTTAKLIIRGYGEHTMTRTTQNEESSGDEKQWQLIIVILKKFC